MRNEEIIQTQREWSERALLFLREMLPLMSPVAQFTGWTHEQQDTVGMLLSATARSSESVMLLSSYGQLWDAELVLRSVFEGSVKFAFLLESEKEFAQRHQEYAEDLFQIALLKDDQKDRELLAVVDGGEAREWQPIRERLLPEAEKEKLQNRYGREIRTTLERRWGFTAMIRALTRSGAYVGFAGLAHGYSIGSHVQHADYVGVSIPMERELRPAERRDSIHLAHLARVISDTLSCHLIRLLAGYRYIRHELSPIAEAQQKMHALQATFGGPYAQWMDIEYGQPAIDSSGESRTANMPPRRGS